MGCYFSRVPTLVDRPFVNLQHPVCLGLAIGIYLGIVPVPRGPNDPCPTPDQDTDCSDYKNTCLAWSTNRPSFDPGHPANDT